MKNVVDVLLICHIMSLFDHFVLLLIYYMLLFLLLVLLRYNYVSVCSFMSVSAECNGSQTADTQSS